MRMHDTMSSKRTASLLVAALTAIVLAACVLLMPKSAFAAATADDVTLQKIAANKVQVTYHAASTNDSVSIELGALAANDLELGGATFQFSQAAAALPVAEAVDKDARLVLVVSNGLSPLSADESMVLGVLTVPTNTKTVGVYGIQNVDGGHFGTAPIVSLDMTADEDEPPSSSSGDDSSSDSSSSSSGSSDSSSFSSSSSSSSSGSSNAGTSNGGGNNGGTSNGGGNGNGSNEKLSQTGDTLLPDISAFFLIAAAGALFAGSVLYLRRRD